ncbi:hypothetical protein [Microbispora sp. ATCC PTA-5024]|uniref:hypothetical protein n=1 Tax=Microbispora sp. ATCC PTA-5024 TaxID=316330 RepID=UPI0003DDAD81|nr:hypothetical protein [Microbispora sp. ATCC PTA-5024]ETK34200.1 hypothetical protein MPTA5024_20845 [Microbispora sp. ATCC PTA-5024]
MYNDYALAAERALELRREAGEARLVHRLASARRWSRLASWAQDHAARASRHLG